MAEQLQKDLIIKKESLSPLPSSLPLPKAEDYFNCSLCDFSTPEKDLLIEHLGLIHTRPFAVEVEQQGQENDNVVRYTCSKCVGAENRVFADLSEHAEHFNVVHLKIKMFWCATCSFDTNSALSCQQHWWDIHGKVLDDAQVEEMRFANSKVQKKLEKGRYVNNIASTRTLRSLVKSRTVRLKHSCSYCEFSTANLIILDQHTTTRHMTCKKCKYVGVNKRDLDDHLLHTHPDALLCPLCCYRFKSQQQLVQHVKDHYADSVFYCDHAGCENFEATNLDQLNTHVLTTHMLKKTQDGEESLRCPHCEFTSETIDPLTRHVKSSHEAQTAGNYYKCISCDFVATRSYNLKEHEQKSHPEGEPHNCSLCSFRTNSFGSLRQHHIANHRVVGSSDNMFHCEYCGFATRKKGNLAFHIKRHFVNGNFAVKEYDCQICEYTSSCFLWYIDHYRNEHASTIDEETGHQEELFKCPECNLTCCGQRSYCQHLESHDVPSAKPMREYQCQLCEFSCKSTKDQQLHVEEVHGGSNAEHKCQFCNYRSNRRYNFRLHMQRHGVLLNGKRIVETHEKREGYVPKKKTFQGASGCFKVRCQLCPYVSMTNPEHRTHIIEMHGGSNALQECTKCEYSTQVAANIRKHMDTMHGILLNGRRPLVAPGKNVVDRRNTAGEKSVTSGIRLFQCQLCNFKCNSMAMQMQHLKKIHGGNRQVHSCWICNSFETSHRNNFRVHMMSKHNLDLTLRTPEESQVEPQHSGNGGVEVKLDEFEKPEKSFLEDDMNWEEDLS